MKEFDVKKNGRYRRVTIEKHRSPLPETGTGSGGTGTGTGTGTDLVRFHEKVVVRFSKRQLFAFRKGGAGAGAGAGAGVSTISSIDGNDDDSSVSSFLSQDVSFMTEEVATAASASTAVANANATATAPTKKKPTFALEMPAIDEHGNGNGNDEPSPSSPTRSNKESQFVTRAILDLKNIQIVQVSNKKITLSLRYKAHHKPEERCFTFRSVQEATDFHDTIQQEKINEERKEHAQLICAVEEAGMMGKIRNMNAFQEEQLDFLIEIVGAENLPVGDVKSSDPYVVARFGDQILHKTKHVSKSLDPVFTLRKHAFFIWSVNAKDLFVGADGLTLIVYDFDFDFGVGVGHEGEE